MSAPLLNHIETRDTNIHLFGQKIPLPSSAVIIAVGVLQRYKLLNSRINVWFDCCPYTYDELTLFLQKTDALLKKVDNMIGAYPWGKISIILFVQICLTYFIFGLLIMRFLLLFDICRNDCF